MRVIATAGHVDHGKSTLVEALTGVDPDRWEEEKARGLTIDLGFGAAVLPSGAEIGFVDVPGHGRFVKNMLAGVGSVDACLFVVAATEGWKAQSEEHLRILELMGVRHGLVALTKVGLVDEEWRQLAALDVQDHLLGTFLEKAEVVEVDVPAGDGIDDLRAALDRLLGVVPASPDLGRPRMWIDRSFSIRGSGTVVTGTLTGGAVAVGDEVAVESGGHRARVRSLQSHYSSIELATPGRRLAVNLTGISRGDATRGQAMLQPDQWQLTACFDASLSVLASVQHPVDRRGAYTVHTGSGEFPVRLRLIGSRVLEPGESGAARLWLQNRARIPLVPGDRYVLREAGRMETIGGGEVLDIDPVLPVSRAAPDRSVARVVRERGWVRAAVLTRLVGGPVEATIGAWVVDPEVLTASRQALLVRCVAAGADGLLLASLDERDRTLLTHGLAGLEVRADRVVDASIDSSGLSAAAEAALQRLQMAAWSPPAVTPGEIGVMRELQRKGLAVEVGSEWFAVVAVEAAVERLGMLLASKPDGFTVAEARDALASSRKHVMPLLYHLDSEGVTRRRGDLRVAGPRMPPRGRPGPVDSIGPDSIGSR
jgi:selenocysteine-specific elongation factor